MPCMHNCQIPMTRCRADAATRLIKSGKKLLGHHAGACHLFIVYQADAKCIFQLRQCFERHILLALQNLRHILLRTIHAFSKGLLSEPFLLHLQQHLDDNLLRSIAR